MRVVAKVVVFYLFMPKKGWWIMAIGTKEMKRMCYTIKNTSRATHTYGILEDSCTNARLRLCFYSVKSL